LDLALLIDAQHQGLVRRKAEMPMTSDSR
jgi:hypothetical protein